MSDAEPFFTDEHEMFRGMVRQFVASELAPYAEEWEERADEIQGFPMQAITSIQNQVMDYPGVTESFDAARTFMPAGQGAGMIRDVKPAADVVRDIVREAEAVIEERFVKPSRQAQKS